MSLETKISALATAAGAAVKDVKDRVTVLEGFAPVVVLTAAAYALIDPGVAGTVYVVQG